MTLKWHVFHNFLFIIYFSYVYTVFSYISVAKMDFMQSFAMMQNYKERYEKII